MRPGGGKNKGSKFERLVCTKLSSWVTKGKHDDVFWRSAISGGRDTVRRKKGKRASGQAGDICAVRPQGHDLLNLFTIECKHVKNLAVHSALVKGSGLLAGFWDTLALMCVDIGRQPLLIAKQNNYEPIVLLHPSSASYYFGSSSKRRLGQLEAVRFSPVAIYTLDDLLSGSYNKERFR